MNFMLQHIIEDWSKQGRWDGWGMCHGWWRREEHMGL